HAFVESANHIQVEIRDDRWRQRSRFCWPTTEGPGKMAGAEESDLFARPRRKEDITLQPQLSLSFCLGKSLGNFEHASNTGGIVTRPQMDLPFLFFTCQ